MRTIKIVVSIAGILLSFLPAVASGLTPDSVYFDSNRILMFTYGSDSVSVLEASFDELNHLVLEERSATRQDSAYMERTLYSYGKLRLNADCEKELQDRKIPVPYHSGYYDYAFFASGRYATVRWEKKQYGNKDEYRSDPYTVFNSWRQESIGEFNFAVLYDLDHFFRSNVYMAHKDGSYETKRHPYAIAGFMIPLTDGRCLIATLYNENLADYPVNHDYDLKQILGSRQSMYDTDTVCVNGKYGLYTMTGQEVIPAVYDSLLTEEIMVRGFKDGRAYLIDYTGHTVAGDLRLALPVLYRYQVLEDDGTMYFLDKNGNKEDTYFYSYISVDDILYPLGLDIVLLPPGRSTYFPKKYQKKYKTYTWVNFIYPRSYMEYERMKILNHPLAMPTEEQWKRMGFEELYGPYDFLTYWEHKEDYEEIIKEYGIDRIPWKKSYNDRRDNMYGYHIKAYHLPKQYKEPKLITGTNEYYRTGDYETLPPSWIIARKKGKYGVFDVTAPDEPVLPFIYDRIDGNNTYLILYKNGLCAYYPLSDVPRYKELQPFKRKLARFRLADGRSGWLSKDDGREYMDNE